MKNYSKLVAVNLFFVVFSAAAMDRSIETLRNDALRVLVQEGYLDHASFGMNLAEDLWACSARTDRSSNEVTNKQFDESAKFARDHSLVFSPCGKICALANKEKISLYNSSTGALIRSLESPELRNTMINQLAFNKNGNLIYSSHMNGKICEWEVASGNMLQSFAFHGPMHYFQAFSPDCQSIALRGDFGNGCQGIWNFKTDDKTIQCDAGADIYAAFHPHRGLLGFGEDIGEGKGIVIWDIANQKVINRLRRYSVSTVVFSHDGNMMAGANYAGCVYIWNTKNWKLQHTLKLDANQYLNIAFSCNDHYIAVGGAHGVTIYDVKTGALLTVIALEGRKSMQSINCGRSRTEIYGNIDSLSFNGCGQLGTVTYNGDIRIWNLLPEKMLHEVRSLSFDQLLILNSLVRPLAAGRVIHLTQGSNAWNIVNQMPGAIKELLAPCLNPAPKRNTQVNAMVNFVAQHAVLLSFVVGVGAIALFRLLKR